MYRNLLLILLFSSTFSVGCQRPNRADGSPSTESTVNETLEKQLGKQSKAVKTELELARIDSFTFEDYKPEEGSQIEGAAFAIQKVDDKLTCMIEVKIKSAKPIKIEAEATVDADTASESNVICGKYATVKFEVPELEIADAGTGALATTGETTCVVIELKQAAFVYLGKQDKASRARVCRAVVLDSTPDAAAAAAAPSN